MLISSTVEAKSIIPVAENRIKEKNSARNLWNLFAYSDDASTTRATMATIRNLKNRLNLSTTNAAVSVPKSAFICIDAWSFRSIHRYMLSASGIVRPTNAMAVRAPFRDMTRSINTSAAASPAMLISGESRVMS